MNFEINSFIVIVSIIGFGVLMAMLIQSAWTMRLLICSYIAMLFVSLAPQKFFFFSYAHVIYFICITMFLVFVSQKSLFLVSDWNRQRFDGHVLIFSVLTWFFIVCILCTFFGFKDMTFFMTKDVYRFFNEYVFYFACAPLIFVMIFSRKLH